MRPSPPTCSLPVTSAPEVGTTHPALNCYNSHHTLVFWGAVVCLAFPLPASVATPCPCTGAQQVIHWQRNKTHRRENLGVTLWPRPLLGKLSPPSLPA